MGEIDEIDETYKNVSKSFDAEMDIMAVQLNKMFLIANGILKLYVSALAKPIAEIESIIPKNIILNALQEVQKEVDKQFQENIKEISEVSLIHLINPNLNFGILNFASKITKYHKKYYLFSRRILNVL